MLGARLAKVFDRLGPPENLTPSGDNDGGVDLDYGTFKFKIKNKTAETCFFLSEWKGLVKGIKIGDNKEQVIKMLGAHDRAFTHPDGLEDYGWKLKAEGATLWVWFDKDGKIKKITAELN